jgi:hypothetical protein
MGAGAGEPVAIPIFWRLSGFDGARAAWLSCFHVETL